MALPQAYPAAEAETYLQRLHCIQWTPSIPNTKIPHRESSRKRKPTLCEKLWRLLMVRTMKTGCTPLHKLKLPISSGNTEILKPPKQRRRLPIATQIRQRRATEESWEINHNTAPEMLLIAQMRPQSLSDLEIAHCRRRSKTSNSRRFNALQKSCPRKGGEVVAFEIRAQARTSLYSAIRMIRYMKNQRR